METKAMGFYHSDGFTAAYNQANKWAGENGRLATLPDIIDARTKANKDDVVWNKYYTTLSAEYVGLSREGKRLIVIAHGIGPMSTLKGIQKAYSWEYKDKTRSRRGGRITQKEFWDLIDGKYGKVEIVDFDNYVSSQKYPFIGVNKASEAKENPLLCARLGENANNFIDKVLKFSREWHRKEANLNIYKDYRTPYDNPEYSKYLNLKLGHSKPSWLFSDEKFSKERVNYLTQFLNSCGYLIPHEILKLKVAERLYGWNIEKILHVVAGAEDSDSAMFEVGGANNCSYGYNPQKFKKDSDDIWKWHLEEGYAYAHLLSIGSLGRVDRGGLIDINIDVGCFEWWNGVRLAGLRHDYDVKCDYIQDGPDANQLLEKYWDKCMIPAETLTNDLGMCGIMKVKNEWFTMTPKKGETMDTHIPEYRVKTIELISKTTFSTLGGYKGDLFFRFGINEISKIAPIGVNAYHFIGHPEVVYRGGDLPSFHNCEIAFYKITIDSSQRLMTASQLEKNLDKMLELMELE